MADIAERPIARCTEGELEGILVEGVEAYLDIPYAKDSGMFEECVPPVPWDGVRDSSKPAPIFPQSTHEIVFHPDGADGRAVEIEQSLDAFRMSIWTPSTSGRRPVVMWIHGGGFASGGCSHPQYDGCRVARDADVVFAGVNYRLGVLGNLAADGVPSNLSLRDLLAAFRWLQTNASNFGGNPDDIVLAGQSAGAWYVVALASTGEIDGQFSRMMIMSCPASQPMSREMAERLGTSFMERVNVSSPSEVADRSTRRILEEQRATARDLGKFGVSFQPYDDGSLLTGDIFAKAAERCGSRVPILAGLTADETTFFIGSLADSIRQMDEPEIEGMISGFCEGNYPPGTQALLEEVRTNVGADDPYRFVVAASTEALFSYRTRQVVSDFDRSWLYQLAAHGDNGDLGATHCADLPILFNSLDRHSNEVNSGLSDEKAAELMSTLRQGMLSFLATGVPSSDTEGQWTTWQEGKTRIYS